jgi:hypothetical protein
MPDLIAGSTIVHSCSLTKPDVGTEHLRWAFFQKWCEDNCGKFIQRWEDGVELPLDDVAEINFWTWAKILDQAPLGGGDGWTAVNSAGVTVFRRAEAGDRYGPWLMEDLRLVLNLLTMTAKEATWTDIEGIAEPTNAYTDTTTAAPGSQALAFDNFKIGAKAEYDSRSPSSTTGTPTARWQVNVRVSPANTGRWNYQGNVNRVYAKGQVSGLSAVEKTIRFVVNTTTYDYDTNGEVINSVTEYTRQYYHTSSDDVIENKWSVWDTYTADTGTSKTTSTTLGSASILDNPSDPWPDYTTRPTDGTSMRGFTGWTLTTDDASTPNHRLTEGGGFAGTGTLGTVGASVALIDWTGFTYR